MLLTLDESSYTGGDNNGNHPIAWQHEVNGGRAWYTGLGHTTESYADSLFRKVSLTMGTLAEPTEMAVLPNGDVLIAQRGGESKRGCLASPSIRTSQTIASCICSTARPIRR